MHLFEKFSNYGIHEPTPDKNSYTTTKKSFDDNFSAQKNHKNSK